MIMFCCLIGIKEASKDLTNNFFVLPATMRRYSSLQKSNFLSFFRLTAGETKRSPGSKAETST